MRRSSIRRMGNSRATAIGSLAAMLILAIAADSRGARGPGAYALVGGRVITVAGAVIEGGTVILRDGLIAAVGRGLRPEADVRVIDVEGLTLTPGIIDGFGSIGLPSPPPRATPS